MVTNFKKKRKVRGKMDKLIKRRGEMALKKSERKVLENFRERLQASLQDPTAEIKLFGSKARGDNREDSDVDVLVIVSSEDWRLSDKVYEIATDLLLETGVSISPKIISARQYEELLRENAPFIRNVIRDAVPV